MDPIIGFPPISWGCQPYAFLFVGAFRTFYRKPSWGLLPLFLVLSLGVLGAGHVLKSILPGYSLVIHSGFWLSLVVFWAAWMAMESLEGFLLEAFPLGKSLAWVGLAVFLYAISYFIAAPLFPPVFWLSLGLLGAGVWSRGRARPLFLLAALGFSLGTAALSLDRKS